MAICFFLKIYLNNLSLDFTQVSYNPVTNEWSTLANMLVPRSGLELFNLVKTKRCPFLNPRSQMGCVVLDEFLYVLGGTNRHNEVLQVS